MLSNDPSTFIQADPLPEWRGDKKGYDWPDSTSIHSMHQEYTTNRKVVSVMKERAIRLLQQEFGTVYRLFTSEIKSDPEILMLAAVQSKGHNLEHAPTDVIAKLSIEWWLEAAKRGVCHWVSKYIPQEIMSDPQIQQAYKRPAHFDK